jgi:protein-S-isoprenylcysteine O-methyltransferase Ste14
MHLPMKALVGAGDRIMAVTLPAAVLGLAANMRWPALFHLGFGATGTVVGIVLLAIGIPLWLSSVVELLVCVPKGKLITGGPFALMLHPVYTSVALLVIPGCGLLFDSGLGFAVGIVLYVSARHFERSEERDLAARFPEEYRRYRKRVMLPWL